MKFRNLIFLCALSFFTFSSLESLAQFSAAISAGANLSNLSGKLDTSPLVRLNFGMWGKYELQENVTAHIGLVYSGTGAQINYPNSKTKYTAANLQLPVYFGYKVINQAPISLSVLGGAYAGFTLSSKLDGVPNGVFYSDPEAGGFDLGLGLGLHADLVEGFGVMATYNYGLLGQVYLPGNNSDDESANRFFQVSLIYTIYKL